MQDTIVKQKDTAFPEKIFPVDYAGFWDFSPDGLYGDSLINEMDYPNAGKIAHEIAKRYNESVDKDKRIAELEEALSDKSFIIDALNAYWHQAHEKLTGPQNLGDIERKNFAYMLKRSKELIEKLDSLSPSLTEKKP